VTRWVHLHPEQQRIAIRLESAQARDILGRLPVEYLAVIEELVTRIAGYLPL
jgi:hypothetical protein